MCGENWNTSLVQVIIHQEIKMYYIVSVDHNRMAVQLTGNDCEGF
jgi:hypothetical protein